MLFLGKTYYELDPALESGDTKTGYLPPPRRSPSARDRFYVSLTIHVRKLWVLWLSPPKTVWSPMSVPLTSGPPGLTMVPGTYLMLNKCVLNWTDLLWGTPYKAVSALNPKPLWELTQTVLCLGKQRGKKQLGEKLAMDVCFNSMKHSFAAGLFLKNHILAVGMSHWGFGDWMERFHQGVLVKIPVKGIPIPSLSPHPPLFP